MSSFFEKLHGKPSSSVFATKVRPTQPAVRTKTTTEKFSYATIAQQRLNSGAAATEKTQHTQTRLVDRRELQKSGNGTFGQVKAVATVIEMRRTQSSSSDLPIVSKKRKVAPSKTLKNPALRDVSRLDAFSPGDVAKRRRTASPAARIHRSPSDDETDFSEPIKLFRGETPDVSHPPPVERQMLNPRAGEDVNFRHAKQLVCVIDKESFVPEDPENPDLEVIVKLPFGEEM
jgi:hypothetical protein